ncbi:CDP-diacylglycerol--inositol 3-phosphatidyltransferase [Holothuria leucospilota]|uniref:CDP-diacylglycerol--inositol 3-phosphatidyltransferase n=1 Tax=Holothuria leucospilota TaxID=206669 RepID=A0A9Q1HE60_HOLLE|nr:CDP-diacylglycerol--inositol 3-phosphatidyltransferase [Holothuria leucospilota]
MRTDYITAAWCYLLSFYLDTLDGLAARYFNQETNFGDMLDQLTDRCATMCLLVTLSVFYPDYMFWFQLSMCLDITGHWLHVHCSTVQGRSSHKFVDPSGNPILRMYYTSMPFSYLMCYGNELFYAMLYLLHFDDGPPVFGLLGMFEVLAYLTAPIALGKSAISMVHLVVAVRNISIIDVAEREAATALKKN